MPEQQLHHQALHQSVLLREVVAALREAGIEAIELSGDLEQRDRDRALLRFEFMQCLVRIAIAKYIVERKS